MRKLIRFRRSIAIGVLLAGAVAALYAQEAQQINRPLAVTQGNVSISRGVVVSGGGITRDYRTSSAVSTNGAATYTAAQVLSGLITRTNTGGFTAVTDVLPTAASLATAIPGVLAGGSIWLAVEMSTNGGVTLNGASTGVTYSSGCGVALDTNDGYAVLITFTSATAYRAVCLPAKG